MLSRSGQETTALNTRLMRIGLCQPESQEYWRQAHRHITANDRVRIAFEERWFGSKSMMRVQYLMLNFSHRFDAFPTALQALALWQPKSTEEQRIICHWHLQLTDPIYRTLTSQHLPERLNHPQPTISRSSVIELVDRLTGQRWATSSIHRMTAGLMGCLNEVGYSQSVATIRPIRLPQVSDRCLCYLLYLLREIEFQGNLVENPYLASLGIDSTELKSRLTRLKGIDFRGLGNVTALDWQYPDLLAWAQGECSA